MNTIIEKIRAEIESKIRDTNNDTSVGAMESLTINKTLRNVLSILSDLEKEEKPMEYKNIDTEIGHWMSCLDDKYCMLVNHYSIQDIKDTARYFAQWGAEHLKQ